ncbi:MAG TPA: DUF4230 domain-containing protein [Allosphingosinicella sp.]|uniref:DUF4230 domain-containing protein n=1 Tax=Allosphingosinicella sp. TaxID=2823234 RepID=UPI002EDAE8BC
MRSRAKIALALAVGLLLGAALIGLIRMGNMLRGPDPETIAAASLQSVREQARLTPFAARFVAVVTSRQTRFGLSAEKTLIMPGMVRYELDLAKLQQRDIAWNEATKTLSISLPPLEISGPEVDLREIREYDGGGVLIALTDAENRLDAANRERGRQELIQQARQPLPMRLARDAARRAVARSFAMPLRAAGIEANVEVRFAGESGNDASYLDRSRRIEDVLKERQAQ